MDDIRTELANVFALLSNLSVSGDAVDIMAAVRQKLRRVNSLLEKEGEDG